MDKTKLDRQMKKIVPRYTNIKEHVGWMYDKKYSYSHLVNTSLGLEHYTRFKGEAIKLARPKKPKRLIEILLKLSELAGNNWVRVHVSRQRIS